MKRTLLAVYTAVLLSIMALMFLGGLLRKAARVLLMVVAMETG
jgi:hypothetical protein